MNDSPVAVPFNSSGVEIGTAAVPVRVDPTGTTAQPITDNAGSLTVDTTQLPAALVGGRLDENVGAWLGSTAPTVGQKLTVASLPVTMARDQPPLVVTLNNSYARAGVSSAMITLGGASAGLLAVMRATAYTEPTTAVQRSVSSANAADAAAGTGARTVKITYFDNTGTGPLTETLTLNGVTPVNTVSTTIRFVEKIEVVTAGSGGANAGVITLFGSTAGGGGTVGTIGVGTLVTGVGDNTTLWAHHYVSALYTAEYAVLIVSAQSGGSGTSARFFVKSKAPLVANSAENIIGDVLLVQGAFERNFDFHPTVVGFARLTAYAVPTVNNATLTAAFDWQETLT